MSNFTVIVLPKAMRDVEAALGWIEARSKSGAENWHRAYLDSLTRLRAMADTFGEALESTAELEIRELIKTGKLDTQVRLVAADPKYYEAAK